MDEARLPPHRHEPRDDDCSGGGGECDLQGPALPQAFQAYGDSPSPAPTPKPNRCASTSDCGAVPRNPSSARPAAIGAPARQADTGAPRRRRTSWMAASAAETAEDAGRCADRAVRRTAQQRREPIAGRAGEQHEPDADAGADQPAQCGAEDHQRRGIAQDVRESRRAVSARSRFATARRRRCAGASARAALEPVRLTASRGPVTTKNAHSNTATTMRGARAGRLAPFAQRRRPRRVLGLEGASTRRRPARARQGEPAARSRWSSNPSANRSPSKPTPVATPRRGPVRLAQSAAAVRRTRRSSTHLTIGRRRSPTNRFCRIRTVERLFAQEVTP